MNLLVSYREKPHVVRIYLPSVSLERLEGIQQAMVALQGKVPCAVLLPTCDGQTHCAWEDRFITAEEFVPSNGTMDTWERLTIGLPQLGRIHSIFSSLSLHHDVGHKPFANHIPAETALSMTRKGVARMRAWTNLTEHEQLVADTAEELAERLDKLEQRLPCQLVHGNCWDNNVLFQDDRLVLVGDFDFMGMRPRIDDVALTFYFADAKYSLFTPDNGNRFIRFRKLLQAYNEGLDIPLSADERAALPLAMARQPLWGIGGWVTRLEDSDAARNYASDMLWYVKWGLSIVDSLDEWREAFA
ncbi:phosphotransferase enzyme family protein [Paenibacillus lignilyticus]|uniref:Phosphotransferase n=1 Tax=Paenibacillus lignilyticus TaxID=1172615 RepID=A0ABS5CAF7_9BACL|nr:phosphotransferase [Paenibacillus lignilyticus]